MQVAEGRQPRRTMTDVDRKKEEPHGNWNEVKLPVGILINCYPTKSAKVNTDLSFVIRLLKVVNIE